MSVQNKSTLPVRAKRQHHGKFYYLRKASVRWLEEMSFNHDTYVSWYLDALIEYLRENPVNIQYDHSEFQKRLEGKENAA